MNSDIYYLDWLPFQVQTKAVKYNKMSKITIYKPLSKLCKNGKYHGCWAIYEDGTRKLIRKGHKCKFPTDDPFWKHPKDVEYKVKTRAQKNKLEKPKMKDVVKYFSKEVDKTEQSLFEIQPNDYDVYHMTVEWGYE